jgi:hypothetical protein
MIPYRLKVQRVEQTCLFELSWGKGQQLTAQLHYPARLTQLYQEWQRVYRSFYNSQLRGRVEECGSITAPTTDWHGKLVQAEASLTYEFHRWLRGVELFEIRAQLAQIHDSGTLNGTADLFLTCSPFDVARLPWETWEIGTEFASSTRLRFCRTSPNIRMASNASIPRQKLRVLVILGDETGLNFEVERKAVEALNKQLYAEFVGWQKGKLGQPEKPITQLQNEIRAALTDEQGWDVLLFAGHSNETEITGGTIAIAPGVSLSIQELAGDLAVAKQRGLQFALFNSCNGLNIADRLIDLGLSQVAVMREPIHNQVAQEFLIQFLNHLAAHRDVHDSLLAACEFLKVKQSLTYPSAYLIPSLFRHPEAELLCLKPSTWHAKLRRILPSKQEAIALGCLAVLSLQLPVQSWLLERRLFVQAVYRDLTNQIVTGKQPPVVVVQIDERSIREANISDPKPLNRAYVASLIDKLVAFNARVVGVDLLFDRPQGNNDRILSQAIQNGVDRPQPTWFTFAAVPDSTEKWLKASPKVANPNWSLTGNVNFPMWNAALAPNFVNEKTVFPLAYLLALSHELNQQEFEFLPQPNLKRSRPLFQETFQSFKDATGKDIRSVFSRRSVSSKFTLFSYRLQQRWLLPILDFSIPPQVAYDRIPAWQLLVADAGTSALTHLDRRVVILAPGGYAEAGLADGSDNFPPPAAVNYWRNRETPPDRRTDIITGGEVHAYLTYQFLTDQLVIPIPDLWMLGAALILAKCKLLIWFENKKNINIVKILPIYGLFFAYIPISLQVYISQKILLPLGFPIAAFSIAYIQILVKEKNS